jgi:hypothetical protein
MTRSKRLEFTCASRRLYLYFDTRDVNFTHHVVDWRNTRRRVGDHLDNSHGVNPITP